MLKDFFQKLESFRDRAIAKIKEVYEDLTQRVKNAWDAVPTPEEGSLLEATLRGMSLTLGLIFVYYGAQFALASALLGAPALVLLCAASILYLKGIELMGYALGDSVAIISTPSMEVV